MMYSTNVQLAKWAFPAAAFIIGLYWYRRRRMHRADPGGTLAGLDQDNIKIISCHMPVMEADTSLRVSNIREIDGSLSVGCHAQDEASACVSRKVSESMNIPVRRLSSQSSSDSGQALRADDRPSCNAVVQLGSNPGTSYFDQVARRRSASTFESEFTGDVTRVFEEVAEEEQFTARCETEPSAQKDVAVKYQRQENRQLTENPEDAVKTQERAAYERDSANHSPVSGVLDGSIADEVRSEGSTDSGKGGSINGGRKDKTLTTSYYFTMPQHLVGRLIGRFGSFLHNILSKTAVTVQVNDHPNARDQKICAMEGSVEGINAALEMIRKKFPEKKFPQVTLAEISISEVLPVDGPLMLQWTLFLIDGVNNDIVVSHIVKPHWLFIQFPTHPTYPSLRLLDADMTYTYNTMESSIPSSLKNGMIFAANWYEMWVRVSLEILDPSGQRHLMRLLDHGGYYEFNTSQIRDIRPEHLNIPFQSTEVFLANIRPTNGVWSDEAYHVIAQICHGVVGQAQVEGYIDSHVYTNVYFNIQKYGVISLADELIARGLAEPMTLDETVPETAAQLFQDPNFS